MLKTENAHGLVPLALAALHDHHDVRQYLESQLGMLGSLPDAGTFRVVLSGPHKGIRLDNDSSKAKISNVSRVFTKTMVITGASPEPTAVANWNAQCEALGKMDKVVKAEQTISWCSNAGRSAVAINAALGTADIVAFDIERSQQRRFRH